MAEGKSSNAEVTLAQVDPLCGRVLNGRFSILEPLGNGGMGRVYKAIQAPLDRMVAVKVLHPHYANSKDPGFVKRFVLEASLTSKLRHPNTVTVIDYGQTEDGIFYIAMEYLEGQTVADLLTKAGALPWPRALYIGAQVCRSLREAHKLGILHRDLKPANVMLLDEADQDVVKVLDFGLVKSFLSDGEPSPDELKVTQTGMLLGSPQYMSPEQARNTADPRSDIYSFGVLLYEMLLGKPPFLAKDYLEVIVKHLKDPPPRFKAVRPDLTIPPDVESLVLRCLVKEPQGRFQSMDEVLDGIRSVGVAGSIADSFQGRSGPWVNPAQSGIVGTPPPLPRGKDHLTTPRPGDVQSAFQYTPPPVPPVTPAPSLSGPRTLPPPHSGHGWSAPSSPAHGTSVSTSGPEIVVAAPEGDASASPFFASLSEDKPKPMGLIAGVSAAAVAVLVVLLLLVRSPTSKPGPAPEPPKTADAKPATPAPPPAALSAAPAKPVKFRVATEPSGAQVFMGARDLGRTPVQFEVPPQSDGTATAELVFILDGYQPLAVTAGGSGEVLIRQKLQKKVGNSSSGMTRINLVNREREREREGRESSERIEESQMLTAPAEAHGDGRTDPARDLAGGGGALPAVAAMNPNVPRGPKLGTDVLPFGEGMSRPQQLSGPAISYTREAIAAKVEGLMVFKCVITVAGKVENCRTIKSLPYMDATVKQALEARVYRPITFQGKPVAVDYVFDVQLKLPRR